MRKFLTKQEIIDKLNSLPDLPVVHRLECDELWNCGITEIEVIENMMLYRENEMEYHTVSDSATEEQKSKSQSIILIS
jgi:hypothetical protein